MSTATAVGLRGKHRRLIAVMALFLASALAVALSALFTQSKAEAHGANTFPGSRQYFCYFDALTESGGLDPYNSACQTALNTSGSGAFYNWFGNLDSNGAGRTEGYIPDGRICDGGGNGPYDFSAFNQQLDWPRTHVTGGATYEWRHNNWAEHPGRFDLYITTDGWDPNQPIGWDDLELFETIQDPPTNGGPGADGNYYYANVTLPQKSGYHIIFTHWVRSDSNENFYSCSDMEFDGGNGEVSGVRPGADLPGNDGGVTDPDPEPTDPEPTDPEPTDPEPTDPEPTDPGDSDCAASASVNSWGSGATVTITVTNNGSSQLSGWAADWAFPSSDVSITNSWNADITSQGDSFSASPVGWNSEIAAGQSVDFGFNVSGSLTELSGIGCSA
ncbi:lytic polysaccharide monooxygenase [Glycomyces xiaoerkulensis]|uniref:lytic polysaccharide monooxygenase n=1 Tax=Glycomyces xiaoerkulensis TaxID=2038139 RepID=UPI000C26497E|nr:lytic polysaccharide monooxygenase [Glycomyces xiaoerkulensis]